MADATVHTIQYEEFNKGIVDMLGTEDIPINTELYIVTDDTVTAIPASTTSAVTHARLGWAARPYVHGSDNVVSVQSKFNRRTHRTAGASVAAGERVVFLLTAVPKVYPYSITAHEERDIIGIALTSAWANYPVEIAEE
jgi:hypothetical protein